MAECQLRMSLLFLGFGVRWLSHVWRWVNELLSRVTESFGFGVSYFPFQVARLAPKGAHRKVILLRLATSLGGRLVLIEGLHINKRYR